MPSSTWVESKKQAEKVEKTKALLAWIKENRETFWGGVAITAAVVAFVIFFTASYSKLQKNAWQALFMAQQHSYSGNTEEGRKIIDNIVKNYSRSSAVPFALMLQADLDFAKGNYEEAEKTYTQAMKKADNELMPVLMFNIAKTYEARHNWDETIKAYQNFLKKYPGHYTAPEVHTNLAVILSRAGKEAESKAAFERIIVIYPDTPWAEQAKKILNPPAEEPARNVKQDGRKAKK